VDDPRQPNEPSNSAVDVRAREAHPPVAVEWPTLMIAALHWSLFAAIVAWHDRLPAVVVVLGFALLAGWYMSLQHEVLHGHPTPWPVMNVGLVYPPLSLWLPYPVYRDSHMRHHRSDLTVPGLDPESFHVDQATWDAAPPWKRSLLRANRTFIGRLVIGPALGPAALVRGELVLARRDRALRRMWLAHVAKVVPVAWLVFVVANVPVWQYLVGYCYLGMSVTYIRSFVEHRAVLDPGGRSAVVLTGPFLGTLFLNNNLHYTHHALPGAPWYRLPQLTDDLGAVEIAAAGAGVFHGYGEVVRRYAFRSVSDPVSPLATTSDRR
jgi:fatty acid desaturase